MIIDLILDRKYEPDPDLYDPDRFFHRCLQYGDVGSDITKAMIYGDEEDVKNAICDYVIQNEYNPEICEYVRSVRWTRPVPDRMPILDLPYI